MRQAQQDWISGHSIQTIILGVRQQIRRKTIIVTLTSVNLFGSIQLDRFVLVTPDVQK
jgi:hypothetical protein